MQNHNSDSGFVWVLNVFLFLVFRKEHRLRLFDKRFYGDYLGLRWIK
jgi:hypothetical protein